MEICGAERYPQPDRRREGSGHAELGDRAPELLHRLGHVLERKQRDGLQTRARREELLVDEVVVRATDRDGEVGLADPADRKAAGRIQDRRLHAAIVHDAEPALGVVHAAAERSAERAVPAVLGVIGATTRKGAALTLSALEVGTELLGRLGDVAVGVVHTELEHRSPPEGSAPLDSSVPRPVQAVNLYRRRATRILAETDG